LRRGERCLDAAGGFDGVEQVARGGTVMLAHVRPGGVERDRELVPAEAVALA
jgi:hypothetical protein